jgi:hypothetical protein
MVEGIGLKSWANGAAMSSAETPILSLLYPACRAGSPALMKSRLQPEKSDNPLRSPMQLLRCAMRARMACEQGGFIQLHLK